MVVDIALRVCVIAGVISAKHVIAHANCAKGHTPPQCASLTLIVLRMILIILKMTLIILSPVVVTQIQTQRIE